MASRVTIRDIAQKLKVHHSTVSRALRNDPRIPATTRKKVQQTSRKMGYYSDPMLSALMIYRTKNAPKNFRGKLAWVTSYPTRDGWKEYEKVGYFAGAQRQAKQLGYEVEPYWLSEPGMSHRRFDQILNTRNVQGLLFIPQPRSHAHVRLEWDRYSAISFGQTLTRPQLRMVHNDHYRSMMILMRQIKRRGYRKPGLVIHPRIHESINRNWAAAFWAFQSELPTKQIPLYMDEKWNLDGFKKWYGKHRPDVIISHAKECLDWIEQLGLHVPDDIGFATPARHGVPEFCSGIEECNELIGEVAVNTVVSMIQHGERGVPAAQIATLIPGTWVNGTSLR